MEPFQWGSPNGLSGLTERAQQVEDAVKETQTTLQARHIHFALVGGLAVAAHGYERMTKDVDVLVLESEKMKGRPLGIPGIGWTASNGVAVDALFISRGEEFLKQEVLTAPRNAQGVPVLQLPALVYLKLKSHRAKDHADVIELLKVDPARIEPIKRWLERHAAARNYLPKYRNLAEAAKKEASRPIEGVLRKRR